MFEALPKPISPRIHEHDVAVREQAESSYAFSGGFGGEGDRAVGVGEAEIAAGEEGEDGVLGHRAGGVRCPDEAEDGFGAGGAHAEGEVEGGRGGVEEAELERGGGDGEGAVGGGVFGDVGAEFAGVGVGEGLGGRDLGGGGGGGGGEEEEEEEEGSGQPELRNPRRGSGGGRSCGWGRRRGRTKRLRRGGGIGRRRRLRLRCYPGGDGGWRSGGMGGERRWGGSVSSSSSTPSLPAARFISAPAAQVGCGDR